MKIHVKKNVIFSVLLTALLVFNQAAFLFVENIIAQTATDYTTSINLQASQLRSGHIKLNFTFPDLTTHKYRLYIFKSPFSETFNLSNLPSLVYSQSTPTEDTTDSPIYYNKMLEAGFNYYFGVCYLDSTNNCVQKTMVSNKIEILNITQQINLIAEIGPIDSYASQIIKLFIKDASGNNINVNFDKSPIKMSIKNDVGLLKQNLSEFVLDERGAYIYTWDTGLPHDVSSNGNYLYNFQVTIDGYDPAELIIEKENLFFTETLVPELTEIVIDKNQTEYDPLVTPNINLQFRATANKLVKFNVKKDGIIILNENSLSQSSVGIYTYLLDISKYINGRYVIEAQAYDEVNQSSSTVVTKSIIVELKNISTDEKLSTSTEVLATSTNAKVDDKVIEVVFEFSQLEYRLEKSGTILFNTIGIKNIDVYVVKKDINGNEVTIKKLNRDLNSSLTWSFNINIEDIKNGEYKIVANASDDQGVVYRKTSKLIIIKTNQFETDQKIIENNEVETQIKTEKINSEIQPADTKETENENENENENEDEEILLEAIINDSIDEKLETELAVKDNVLTVRVVNEQERLICMKEGTLYKSNERCLTFIEDVFLRNKDCAERNIKKAEECELLLNGLRVAVVKNRCSVIGDNNIEECKTRIVNTLIESARLVSTEEQKREDIKKRVFKSLSDEQTLGKVVETQDMLAKVKSDIKDEREKTLSINQLREKLNENKNIIPVLKGEKKYKLISAKEEIVIDEEEKVVQTLGVMLIADSDEDGIPDEVEIKLGTNPMLRDTDGDGYSDRDEIRNGYNPTGVGVYVNANLAPIHIAFLEERVIEHPKTSGVFVEELNIISIIKESKQASPTGLASSTDDNYLEKENGFKLEGKGNPNTTLTLYIYSDLPIVVTVETDEFGNWKYVFEDDLVDGEHEVYIAINDEAGKVVAKSNPFRFLVKEAQAISPNEIETTTNIKNFIPSEDSLVYEGGSKNYYIWFSILFIVSATMIFSGLFIYNRGRKINQ